MTTQYIKITVMSGAEDGRVFDFEKTPVIMGRHHDDDVYLPHDIRVSRHHARIIQEEDIYYIEDVGPEGKGSANGTYIGDKEIDTRTVISSGEVILLGTVLVRFELQPT